MENTNPQSYEDVKVFAGDKFYPACDASYKNLNWRKTGKYKYKLQTCQGTVQNGTKALYLLLLLFFPLEKVKILRKCSPTLRDVRGVTMVKIRAF